VCASFPAGRRAVPFHSFGHRLSGERESALVVDIDRFITPSKLVAYFGVLPIEGSSGVDRRFAERDKARMELEKLGFAVEPALRAALSKKPSLEVRRRIEAMLEKLAGAPRWRFLRALEVLESIATPESRQVLEALSQGTAELWPTQEAKAAFKRLKTRPAPRP
jgi:hypothetical protein